MVHRPRTAESLQGLYRESCAIVLRHYRRPLTVAVVARAIASSPRQVQRAFDEVGGTSFTAFLREVRLRNAAELLAAQPLTGVPGRLSATRALRQGLPPPLRRHAGALSRLLEDSRRRGRAGVNPRSRRTATMKTKRRTQAVVAAAALLLAVPSAALAAVVSCDRAMRRLVVACPPEVIDG